jgi:hypothetical protein
MTIHNVTAHYPGRYSTPELCTSRHTVFTDDRAQSMVRVHERARDERGEHVTEITVQPLDIDPSQLVLVIEPGETITRCPSYYAADTETLQLTPGEYPVFPTTVDGREASWDNPYYINASVPAVRIDGRTYSGFGGVNFSSRELPHEPVQYGWSTYAYHLGHLLDTGKIRVRNRQ